jgi:hypothetical protein
VESTTATELDQGADLHQQIDPALIDLLATVSIALRATVMISVPRFLDPNVYPENQAASA